MDTFPIPPPPHDQGKDRDGPEGGEALVNRLIVEIFNLETLLFQELALIRVRLYALLPCNPPAVRGQGRAFTDPPAPAPAPAPARPDAGPDAPG